MSIGKSEPMGRTAMDVIERRPMSRAEFEALPDTEEYRRAEYVDGVALVAPPALGWHNSVGFQLMRLLSDGPPGLRAVHELGIDLPDSLRIPDVAVVRGFEERQWVQEPPVLVAEVLSRSTRSQDLFRKPAEYQAIGIGQYWIVDPEHRTVTVLGNNGDAWDVLLELDAERPTGSVEVGEYGSVTVDLDLLFT